MIKKVEKIWGHEEWMINNELYCLKKLVIRPGGCCSLHMHPMKDESFHGLLGKFMLEIDGAVEKFNSLSTARIAPGTFHRFWVPPSWKREAMFWEVSTHHEDSDVVRLEESKILTTEAP